jgi:outer membrane cobalamin receptor
VEAERAGAEQVGFLPIRFVTAREVGRRLAWQGAEALTGLPGVFVRDYGGLGGLKTVSIRGLGAPQVAVLWEGVLLNTPLHGIYDMGNIPAAFVEELVLSSGGNSAVVGAYAGSGVISLQTFSGRSEPELRTLLGIGSFGERRVVALGQGGGDGLRAKLGFQYAHADGDYPFLTRQFGELRTERRRNGDYTALTALVAGRSDGTSVQAWLYGLAGRSYRGVPGAVVQGRVEAAYARLDEADWLTVAGIRWAYPNVEARLGVRSSWLQYVDPEARVWGPQGAHDEATTQELSLSLRWGGQFVGITTEVWGDARRERVFGSLLRPQGRQEASRSSAALGIRLRRSFPWAELFAALRWEAHRAYAPALSPSVGGERRWGPFRVQLQWSLNFRPPSFAELYYFNFGNPELRPERTSSWNLGLEWGLPALLQLRVDVFSLWLQDHIVALPRSPVFWSAANVGRVWSRGLEVAAVYRPWQSLQLFAQLTWQRVTDQTANPYTRGRQLPYVPPLMGALQATAVLAPLEAELRLVAVGERWSQPDNAAESRLAPYVLADVALATEQPLTTTSTAAFRVAVRNVFNTAYEIIRNYPLPGRSLRLEVEYRWLPYGSLPSQARH